MSIKSEIEKEHAELRSLPMTTEKFLKLSIKDFEDGAIQNGIYLALKEREEILEAFYKIINLTLNRMNAHVIRTWRDLGGGGK